MKAVFSGSFDPITLGHVDIVTRADAIIRGLRFGGDFDYELQMAHLNKAMSGIETILLPAGREFGTISSSMIRSAACNGGNVSEFVPAIVDAALRERFPRS